MKVCTKCQESKPLTEFFRDARLSDGLQCRCKPCMRAATNDWAKRNPEKCKERQARRVRTPGASTEYVRKWRAANPEKAKALNAPSDKRREIDRKRYRKSQARSDAVKSRLKELNKRRPEIKRAIVARRRSMQRNAVPAWADLSAIKRFYLQARRLELETGGVYHVDHIVPLQSDVVCGLHVEANLQILLRAKNIAKGNRQWPDMP